MKKIKILSAPFFVVLPFVAPQIAYGMDGPPSFEDQKRGAGIQLTKGPDHTLEAVLGTGNNVLLRLRVDLKDVQSMRSKEQVEVSTWLYLTDFNSIPTKDEFINKKIKVDCDFTPAKLNLPNRPKSFESYSQFTDWLHQGYFSNETRITYDFRIDPLRLPSSLTQQLYVLTPGGYHFIGTHVLPNEKIQPDNSIATIAFTSQRGTIKATTVTLGGTLYLNKKPYPIEDYQQVFPHPLIETKVCKTDHTKKFYHHQWLANSEITAIATYEEFPAHKLKDWPKSPSGQYTKIEQKPGDFQDIRHLACWNGCNGEEVDISKRPSFVIDCEVPDGRGSTKRSLVKDAAGNLYTVQYVDLKILKVEEEQRRAEEIQREKAAEEARRQQSLKEKYDSPEAIKLKQEIEMALQNIGGIDDMIQQWQNMREEDLKHSPAGHRENAIAHWESQRNGDLQKAKTLMNQLYQMTGVMHPRMTELNNQGSAQARYVRNDGWIDVRGGHQGDRGGNRGGRAPRGGTVRGKY